jgi:hypothetical protein
MCAVRPLMLLILLLSMTLPSAAQEAEKWYYAYQEDTGSIIAFTADGETNVLIDSGVTSVDYARRLDAQTAFASLTMPTGFGPVVLTPDQELILTPTFSPPDLYAMTPDEDTHRFYLLAYHAPYLVLTTRVHFQGGTGLVANLETGEVELLGNYLIQTFPLPPVVISQDGQFLRYLRFNNEIDDQWSLIERTLATDEERVVYSAPEHASAQPFEFGERWLLLEPDDEPGRIVSILSIDGTREQVGVSNAINRVIFGLIQNSIYETPTDCENGCSLTVTPLDGGVVQVFTAPPGESAYRPVFQPDADHLVVLDMGINVYSLLSMDDEPVSIGYLNVLRILTNNNFTISPDGRFLLVVNGDDPTEYGVYDFVAHDYALQESFEDTSIISISYGEGGFVVSEDQERHQLYRYADSSLIPLPDGAGYYFDVLTNGDVLFTQLEDTDERSSGLYRFSPEDDTFTLLVVDARAIVP